MVRPVTFPMILDTYTLCADETRKGLEKGRGILPGAFPNGRGGGLPPRDP